MTTLLAQLVGEENVRFYRTGEWIEVRGRITKPGWHVSVFPKRGDRGTLVFDEFHVTEELRGQGLANNHHFYSDEGYIQENHLDTVALSSPKWKIANELAAEIYQHYLEKYVTAAMLDQQVKDVTTLGTIRRKSILSVEEYQSQQAEKAAQQAQIQQELQRQAEERKRLGLKEKEIDMFASDSDEDEPSQPVETLTATNSVEPITTSTSQPITPVPSVSPTDTSREKKRKAEETQTKPPEKKTRTEKPDDKQIT